MKKTVLFLIMVFALSVSLPVAAAQKQTDSNMQIMLDKMKADKKLLVAGNMNLSDAEAKKFWPVYDAYQVELGKLNKRVVALIKAYADDYNNNSLTDEKSKKLVSEMIAIDEAEAAMKKSFAPKLYKVLPAIKVARYLQIENKIRAAVKYELASAVPLVP